MPWILISTFAVIAICDAGLIPERPHIKYGLPTQKTTHETIVNLSNTYGIPKLVLPIEPVTQVQERYGVPVAEYGVPFVKEEVSTAAPVFTQYEYGIPTKIHNGVPIQPQEQYGVLQVKEITTSTPVNDVYKYEPKIHEKYDVPKVEEAPLKIPKEYGVPEMKVFRIAPAVKPMVIQYEYNIPHVPPKIPFAEYGVPKTTPEVPHSVYGVPAQ